MNNSIRFIGIIPARYASTRFPGKPLADIRGKSMIQRVYEQASIALEEVYVATDDERIFQAVKAFNGRVVMTSSLHKSGTDRCAEAVQVVEQQSGMNFDVVLNIQGDEPFIDPEQIGTLKDCFSSHQTQIATLVKVIRTADELFDPNRPKVVINKSYEALYFSRSTIPYIRGKAPESWPDTHPFYLHIGLYGYRRDILPHLTVLQQSSLELAESLEQLRWLENGFRITVRMTTRDSFGIDTPEDLERLLSMGGSMF